MQRADQFHEQMPTGGDRDDFRLGLAGAVRVREKPALGSAQASKDEQATAQEQGAGLVEVFHELILAPVRGKSRRLVTLLRVPP